MKQLLWIGAFFVFLFAGDRLGGLALQRLANDSGFRYTRLYRGDAGADLLFVGNSRGLTFYQPSIEAATGKTTFNLSYNGLPADLAAALVRDYLDRYPAPEKMIVDITLCDRANDELLAGFLPYADHSQRISTLIYNRLPKIWWGGKLSALFCCNSEVFQRTLFYRNKSDRDWLLDRVIDPSSAAVAGSRSYDFDVQPHLLECLGEMARAAREKGVRVELVVNPYFPGFQVKNLDKLVRAAEQATGLPVRDYSRALENPAFFGDYMHPNKSGAGAYIDLLLRDGLLP